MFDSEGESTTLLVPVRNEEKVVNDSLSTVLSSLVQRLGGRSQEVTEAFAVNNQSLRLMVQNAMVCLEGKLADTKSLFRKDDWKDVSFEDRRKVIHYLGDYASSFRTSTWNNGEDPSIIPMIQRVPLRLAKLIAKGGFGVVPMAEKGLYGRGHYFTSSLEHARLCAGADAEGEEFAYLLSLVVPGNAFPVVEKPDANDPKSVLGRACRPGYQSHYALVQINSNSLRAPLAREDDNFSFTGELVTFDPSQALPLFIFKTSKSSQDLAPSPWKEWALHLDSSWRGLSLFFNYYFIYYFSLVTLNHLALQPSVTLMWIFRRQPHRSFQVTHRLPCLGGEWEASRWIRPPAIWCWLLRTGRQKTALFSPSSARCFPTSEATSPW